MDNQKPKTVADYIRKVADMESDVKTTIKVFAGVLKSFGIDENTFENGVDTQQQLPKLVARLGGKIVAGTFDSRALSDMQALMPIIEKYKYLTDEIKNEHKQIN